MNDPRPLGQRIVDGLKEAPEKIRAYLADEEPRVRDTADLPVDRQPIRQLPAQVERVETGPVQFGDDWPGVFIRGDDAAFHAASLRAVMDGIETPLEVMAACNLSAVTKLLKRLESCSLTLLASREGVKAGRVRPIEEFIGELHGETALPPAPETVVGEESTDDLTDHCGGPCLRDAGASTDAPADSGGGA